MDLQTVVRIVVAAVLLTALCWGTATVVAACVLARWADKRTYRTERNNASLDDKLG